MAGTFKRKTITAKLPAHLQTKEKRRKVEEKQEKEEEIEPESSESEEEENFTKADLMELIKRETTEEIEKIEQSTEGEVLNESDDEEILATNTWSEHIEHKFDGKMPEAKAQKLGLPFHLNSSLTGTKFDVFENLDELHIKKRIQDSVRNIKRSQFDVH